MKWRYYKLHFLIIHQSLAWVSKKHQYFSTQSRHVVLCKRWPVASPVELRTKNSRWWLKESMLTKPHNRMAYLSATQFHIMGQHSRSFLQGICPNMSLLHDCEIFANLRLKLYSAGIRISSVYQWSYNWPTAWLAARFPVRWPDHNLISTRKQHNSKQQGYQPTATSCRVWILNSFFPGLLVNVNLYTLYKPFF